KAEVRNFTINQHPFFDTLTEGDRSVTFICEASGHPSPALHISFGSEQVAVSEHTSDNSITSQIVLTYTIPRVHCDDKGNYTCSADNGFTKVASVSVQLHVKNCDATEDTPLAAIVGGVVGGILVLTTVAIVGLDEADRPHSYIDVLPPDNTYDPLQITGRQSTAVYTDLRPTGPGGRGADKAEVHNFTVNQRPHSDTVTEGDTSVSFICKASGYPTPTLRITFGSTQVSQSEQTSADKITSETVLTYTIPRVHCDDKGNYTCTADNGFTGAASVSVHLNINSCGKKPDEDLPAAAIVGGVLGVLLVLTTAALVGVLIWMKRNPRYEKPLPRRERKSDAYTGLQPPDNNTDRQSTAGIVNPQLQAEVDESNRLHSYQNVLSPPDNTYDPLQVTERQNTAVYTELRTTGPGGRETDKAEVHNFTINQHPHTDTVTEGDRSVTFICEASGHPTPTLHISFGSEQVALNATEDTPVAAIVGGVVGGILVLTTATVVGVLIWMKRNSRYEKPLPRRERESDAYTGIHPSNNDTGRQSPAGIANHQLTTDLDEENCLHNYQNLSRPDNTYDPLQMTGRQDTAVYTDLHPTGSGGRGTDADEYELTSAPSPR
ncbi:hypothetical protein BaRGS_00011257, partial [Batillaria attramentaria]